MPKGGGEGVSSQLITCCCLEDAHGRLSAIVVIEAGYVSADELAVY